MERVFARNRTAVMFAVEFPCAGDARPFDLFDQPLLAVRGSDGTLRIFHNIVPYDGCLALLRPARGLKSINTHYHGLRYDLSGRLVGAPTGMAIPRMAKRSRRGSQRRAVWHPLHQFARRCTEYR
ncbi:MAG: Rieske 2Fe-2S domain-containing protein [Alphaproteobacteria bacterium]|nr:Rieske 2Fe-2S domain-containing protein [Alphaproteobacteria bacterium]